MTRCKVDGRRNKGEWAKVVTGIDRNQKGGYAIEGEFVDINCELDLQDGQVVVYCDKDKDVFVYVVDSAYDDSNEHTKGMRAFAEGDQYLSLRKQLPSLLDRIEAALQDLDPRQAAIAQIKQIMSQHQITMGDLI